MVILRADPPTIMLLETQKVCPSTSPSMTTTSADSSSDGTGLSQDGDRSETGRPDAEALELLRLEQASLLACQAAVETVA